MKKVFIHIVGTAATNILFVLLLPLVDGKASISEFFAGHSESIVAIVVFLAVILSMLVIFVHYALNYLFFYFSSEYRACGLYFEAYTVDQVSNLSLLVVSFDLRREQLRLVGHAYHKSGAGLEPWAGWTSRAVSAVTQHDDRDFELFYTHQGALKKDVVEHRNVLGTTSCTFPLDEKLCKQGWFCDLTIDAQEVLTQQPFEIVRASKSQEKEFRKEMSYWGALTYLLKVGTPPESVFQSFALRKKGSLLEPSADAVRGVECTKVFQTFT